MKLLDDDGENKAVRWFLACYGGGGGKSVGAMKLHLTRLGFDGFWPDWCNTSTQSAHLTKGGAQLWIRHLFNLELQPAPDCKDTGVCVRSGLYVARSEQEPVAKYIGECSEGSLVQLYDDVKKGTALYTAPPKREWVGLTEMDIRNIFPHASYPLFLKTVSAIEATLKELNHD